MGFSLSSLGDIASGVGALVGAGASAYGAINPPKPDYTLAQKQIQWRVADAQKAGISPLAALGASSVGSGYSPVGAIDAGTAVGAGLEGLGAAASRAGQRRSRAPMQAAQLAASAATTDAAHAQAELYRAQSRTLMAKMNAQPDIERQVLDLSNVIDPTTNRLAMANTPTGWHRLDTSTVPQSMLEDEYGEAAEIYGLSRYGATLGKNRGSRPGKYPSVKKWIKRTFLD